MEVTNVADKLLSLEEENCLKSALAFVVIRSRIKRALEKECKDKYAIETNSENKIKRSKSRLLTNESIDGKNDDLSNCSLKPMLQGLLSPSHLRVRNIVDTTNKHQTQKVYSKELKNDHKTSLNFSTSNLISKKSHILSMFRVALSITLPLYDNVLIVPGSVNFKNERPPDSINVPNDSAHKKMSMNDNSSMLVEKNKFFPPVYDLNAVVLPISQQKSEYAQKTYGVLDGLLANIASHLVAMIYQPSFSTDSDIEKSTKQQSENVSNLISNGLLELMFPAIFVELNSGSMIPSSSSSSLNNTVTDESILQDECLCSSSNAQTILSICTVLHRISYVNTSTELGIIAIQALARLLNVLYHDKCQRPLQFLDSQQTNSMVTKEDKNKSNEKEENTLYLPKLADVIAVNCLYLLEGITALQLQNAQRNQNPRVNMEIPDKNGNKASQLASRIIFELQHELSSITVPIRATAMAQFYHIECKRQRCLAEKKKHVIWRIKKSQLDRRGVCNVDPKDKQGMKPVKKYRTQELENTNKDHTYNDQIDDGIYNDEGISKSIMEDVILCAGGKMMLRYFLFDLLEKISCSVIQPQT